MHKKAYETGKGEKWILRVENTHRRVKRAANKTNVISEKFHMDWLIKAVLVRENG